MTEKEIKKERKTLIKPLAVYIILFLIAVGFHRYGSKKPTPQTVSFFASAFCLTFTIFYGIKLYKFNKFIKDR